MTTGVASAAPAAAAGAAPEHWPLRSRARAKVNLYLHVVGRRVDGYHLLDTLAVFPEVGDLVLAGPAGLDPDGAGSLDDSARGASVFGEAAGGEVLALELAGPQAGSLVAEADNLVLRAARALARDAGIAARARLRLEKHLPVASGIGGGSADAAAALRVLGRLWSVPEALRPGGAALSALALRLGADVPVCIEGRPARMGGIGEELTPAPALPECGMALVNPGLPVATPSVFRARTGGFSPPASLPEGWADAVAMAADLAGLRNDLEAPAIGLCPAIAEVLAALRARPGCLLARMSGSGATCFGLFADAAGAEHAAAALARPGWWCWGGRVGRHP